MDPLGVTYVEPTPSRHRRCKGSPLATFSGLAKAGPPNGMHPSQAEPVGIGAPAPHSSDVRAPHAPSRICCSNP